MSFCQTDFLFYQRYFLATQIIDKDHCQTGCSNITWDIGHGKMPFLHDLEGMVPLRVDVLEPLAEHHNRQLKVLLITFMPS